MKYTGLVIVGVIFAAFALSVAAGVALGSAVQEAQEEPAEEPPPPLAIPPGYRYEQAGRRDPFVNPVPPPVIEVDDTAPEVRPPGLPGVLLDEAQLLGLVASPDEVMQVVLILAPGARTFVARPGDELFDATITEIRPDSVVFELKPREGDPPTSQPEFVVREMSPQGE